MSYHFHLIQYEAVITPGNEQFVHHFEVFHCQSPTRPFAGDCSRDKPPEARSCSKVLAAWSMGANVKLSNNASMPKLFRPSFIHLKRECLWVDLDLCPS